MEWTAIHGKLDIPKYGVVFKVGLHKIKTGGLIAKKMFTSKIITT